MLYICSVCVLFPPLFYFYKIVISCGNRTYTNYFSILQNPIAMEERTNAHKLYVPGTLHTFFSYNPQMNSVKLLSLSFYSKRPWLREIKFIKFIEDTQLGS